MKAKPAFDPLTFAAQSDESLARLVQAGGTGSAEAFGLLLERMTPVIRARVNILSGGSATSDAREDLMQEGVIGFLSAISAYAPERGASFRTFASVCAGNRIVSALRRSSATAKEIPLPEGDMFPGATAEDPQELFFAMEETRRMAEVIRCQLTAMERNVLEAFLAGERYGSIAQRLGVGVKAVDNALQRVRRKLQRIQE